MGLTPYSSTYFKHLFELSVHIQEDYYARTSYDVVDYRRGYVSILDRVVGG